MYSRPVSYTHLDVYKRQFYLCGPTWPVPDITQALQDIISADAEERGIKVDLDAAIEDLKDTSRYILEVY